MSAAIHAKSAKARAGIAARMLKKNMGPNAGRRWGLGRSFDDCFEMFDGEQVKEFLIEKARHDADLRAAMRKHYNYIPADWIPPEPEAQAVAEVQP